MHFYKNKSKVYFGSIRINVPIMDFLSDCPTIFGALFLILKTHKCSISQLTLSLFDSSIGKIVS